MDPGGAPSISSIFIPTLRNINIGGTKNPVAGMQTTAVVVSPLSADVILATYLRPVPANTLVFLLGTAEILVFCLLNGFQYGIKLIYYRLLKGTCSST